MYLLLAQSPPCVTDRGALLQAKTEQLRLEDASALAAVTARLDSLTHLLQGGSARAPQAASVSAAAARKPSVICFPEALAALNALGAEQQAPMIGHLTQIALAATRQASDLLTYTEECAVDRSHEGAARPRLEESHAVTPDATLPRAGGSGDASNTTLAGSAAAVGLAVPEDQDVTIRETPAHLELRAVRCAQCALLCCTLL